MKYWPLLPPPQVVSLCLAHWQMGLSPAQRMTRNMVNKQTSWINNFVSRYRLIFICTVSTLETSHVHTLHSRWFAWIHHLSTTAQLPGRYSQNNMAWLSWLPRNPRWTAASLSSVRCFRGYPCQEITHGCVIQEWTKNPWDHTGTRALWEWETSVCLNPIWQIPRKHKVYIKLLGLDVTFILPSLMFLCSSIADDFQGLRVCDGWQHGDRRTDWNTRTHQRTSG